MRLKWDTLDVTGVTSDVVSPFFLPVACFVLLVSSIDATCHAMASPSRSGSVAKMISSAFAAIDFNSLTRLALSRGITYLGAN